MRTVNIQLTEQTPQPQIVRFLPDLSTGDGVLILNRYYEVITDNTGTGSISLPTSNLGAIKYRYEIPGRSELSTGSFYLTPGAPVDLWDLIELGVLSTPTINQYIDEAIAAQGGGVSIGGNVAGSTDNRVLFTNAGKLADDPTFTFDPIGKVLKLLDTAFVGLFGLSVTRFFNIGTSTRFAIPTGNHMIAEEVNLPVTVSGSGKFYVGKRTRLDVQGTTATPYIIGNWIDLFSNASYPSGASQIYGTYSSVDVGGAYADACAGVFDAIAGGSGASGMAKIAAVRASVIPAHNGNTTEAFAGEFEITTANSSPSVVGTVSGARVKVTVRDGNTFNDLRGVNLSGWSKTAGGSVGVSYGIYADASIDIGDLRYFIYSLSTSPSLLSGPLSVPDDAYNATTWNGSNEVPTKNAIRDKIETLRQTSFLTTDRINNNPVANTMQDVTGLSFAVTAGQRYYFRFVVSYQSAATTTGSRWSVSGPASPTELRFNSEYSLTATTRTMNEGLAAYDLPAATNASSAATTSNMAIVEGFITPSASGTVTARFASEVASSAITAKAGSLVEYQAVS